MGLNLTATAREVRIQFRILSMIYHPDKYSPATLDISPLEAQAHFQLINNAHAYLRTCNL
jgi:curved DNA-binding protein CbpA